VSSQIDDLDHAGARELLRSQPPLARLAYTGRDGFPRVIPIGFLWDGERIVMSTAPTAPKVRALAARPQVALTIDTADPSASNQNPAARALLVRGMASIEIVDGVPYTQSARISIEPTWARYYDFGSGRVPEFLLRPGQP
jgi:nitroimidazol reductase NimA-like FMN-containing flavoprotein (pyridoxamine 5'-phosphate oxidase superfamily)